MKNNKQSSKLNSSSKKLDQLNELNKQEFLDKYLEIKKLEFLDELLRNSKKKLEKANIALQKDKMARLILEHKIELVETHGFHSNLDVAMEHHLNIASKIISEKIS